MTEPVEIPRKWAYPPTCCGLPTRLNFFTLSTHLITRLLRRARTLTCLPGLLLLAQAAPGAAAPAPPAQTKVAFSTQIQPILSDNCFQCHGPDEKARKGKFRLDTREGAFRLKDGKSVLVPGKSAESELFRRLISIDPDEVMPPPEAHRKLTLDQINLLKRWIDQGAEWESHWAFNPIRAASPPPVKTKGWVRNGIDPFILAQLEQAGIKPSPEAGKERLLRRVSFDLTGLPPTVPEIDAFLGDSSTNDFEKVVDRLLASPRYGERMSAHWLDLARYADTYGYQYDATRPVSPYRDWVIKAFNNNLPFDQFVTWQLAGDLLPGATREQRLATAFNRLHLQNEEGGVVEEEFRVSYVVDRVNTFGTAVLGLTFECSRCHDHKFDPITMRDFYSLFAFFQNIDEAGQNPFTGMVDYTPTPTLLLSDDATDARLARLAERIARHEGQLGDLRQAARGAFEEWLPSRSADPAVPGLAAAFSFDEIRTNKVANSVDASKPGNARENPALVEGKTGQAALLSGESGFTFPGIGHFTRTDPFTLGLWIQTPSHLARAVVLHHTKAPADAGSRGYELLLENGRLSAGVHRMWPGDSLKIRTKELIPTNAWVHIALTYDGSSRAAGLRLFLNGTLAEIETIRDKLRRDITYAAGEPDLTVGFRFRDAGFKGGKVDDLRIFTRCLTPIEVAEVAGRDDLRTAWKTAPGDLQASQKEALLDYYVANFYPPANQLLAALTELRREANRTVSAIPEIMAMEELPEPKPAYILKRGAYDAPGELVSPDTPKALPAFPLNAPRNRLGLAQWATSPANPLMARVTVNRAWQMMFGRGLVETSDNFGAQGAAPTHPELLDWLADRFMASGWNYKELLKTIVLSAVYRQSSKAGPDLLERDPENKLLARGPARRLTAEMLRDHALAVSGLLVEKLGGPSVKPYQPAGLWEIAMGNPKYDQGRDEDLHRRSLYTFWKRTVPPPAMVAFDAPQRNVCTVHRQSTSTPLQALALLNDTQVVEASRFLSQRMLKEGGATAEDRITWAFRLATSRKPVPRELELLKKLWLEQRAWFAGNQQAAARLLAVGEAPNDPALPIADLAAGTVLAEALLNHDEAVMCR